MGKAKRNRAARPRGPEPTGLPSVRATEQEEEAGMSEMSGVVLSLMEKLQSPSPDERECTCSTIANLVSQPGVIRQFLQAGLVRVAGPLLIDASFGVRQAVLGALRNLTVDGGLNACTEMIEQDVMTPLVALLQKYGPDLAESDKSNPEVMEAFHQSIHLLWNLCEASPTAVKIFNQQNLLPILLPCLLPDKYGYQIAITTAQCLYTVTEDNAEISRALCRAETLRDLQGLLTTPDTQTDATEALLHQVLIAGVLYNVSSGQLASLGAGTVGHVTDILVAALQHDVTLDLARIAEFLTTLNQQIDSGSQNGTDSGICGIDMVVEGDEEDEEEEGGGDNKETSTKPPDGLEVKHRELDKMLAETGRKISAQQVAVEMTANLCCGQEDEDQEDEDWEDTDEDTDPEEITADSVTMDDNDDDNQLVFEKLKPLDAEISTALGKNSQTKSALKSYDHLTQRALLCTSNLVGSLAPEEIGGRDALLELWALLSRTTRDAVTTDSMETLEGGTAALRAVVSRLADSDSEQLSALTDSDLAFLYKLGTECQEPQVRANSAQITAVIGETLTEPAERPRLKAVGEFLYQVASRDAELWVAAEALDAMFDVFADDDTDPVVKEMGLVAKLRDMVPELKQKFAQQKRSLGDRYPIVSTAKTNLLRFIKYKSRRKGAMP